MFVYPPDLLRKAVNEYCDYLPIDERKELKDELKYNLKFYDDFSHRLADFSSLVYLFASDNNDKETVDKFIEHFITKGSTDNPFITKMYHYYLHNLKESLDLEFGEGKGNIVISHARSVLEKILIHSQLSVELKQNEKINHKVKI